MEKIGQEWYLYLRNSKKWKGVGKSGKEGEPIPYPRKEPGFREREGMEDSGKRLNKWEGMVFISKE